MSYESSREIFKKLFNHELSDEAMRELLISIKLDKEYCCR